jgi:signal peptidase I
MTRPLRLILGLIGVVLLAVVWYFFAPTQLGGQASYVTIRGVSMEPLMHKGDLVILRKRSHYDIGDIVAYRSTDIHQVVLHRIVGRDGEHYIMRGDNTQGPDRERPVFSDFVGERWIQLDGMGTWLERAKEPKSAALLAGLAVLLAGGTVGASHSRRKRRPKTTTPPLPRRTRPASPPLTAALVCCGLLGAIALLLALVSFSRAPTKQVKVPNLWQEKGSFSYSGSAKKGIAYPSGHVKTGEPVFLKLVKKLHVGFDYQASSSQALSLSGKASLVATITADSGQWQRTFTLAPERSFKGTSAHMQGTLSLSYLHSLMTGLQDQTGVPIDSFVVTIVPHVTGQGLVAGSAARTDYSPVYLLQMDYNQLAPATTGPSGPLTDNSPLRTQTDAGSKSVASHLALRVATPTVHEARIFSLLLLALSAIGALLIFARMRLRPELDEPSEIERRFGDLLVPVGSVKPGWANPVEVESIEALVHLAERYDRAILHLIDDGMVHHYMVEEEGTVYRYVAFQDVAVGSPAYEQAARAQAGAGQAQAPTSSPAGRDAPEAGWPELR